MRLKFSGLLMVVLMASLSAAAVDRTALVIPSRKALVDLMFDARAGRPGHLEMISYSKNLDGTHRLYVFDQMRWEWRPLSLSSWREGRCFRGSVKHAVLVGGEDLPDALRHGMTWDAKISELSKPSYSELLNTLNESLRFKQKHWKRLAVKYDLVLKDLNWELRRYGRYGRPLSGEDQEKDAEIEQVDSEDEKSATESETLDEGEGSDESGIAVDPGASDDVGEDAEDPTRIQVEESVDEEGRTKYEETDGVEQDMLRELESGLK